MMNRTAIVLVMLVAVAGCRRGGQDEIRKNSEEFHIGPLPVQQARAYAETVTGRFVSLADFEDSPLPGGRFSKVSIRRGHNQVRHFSILPAAGRRKFVVNITRTGAGAMEATLPPASALVYRLPVAYDFSRYTLLMLAIYSRNIRDDLTVRISTDRAGWESGPVLLRPGWNNVLIDLQRLKTMKDFDTRDVRSISLRFPASREPVCINIDDIMLIDNRREIAPLPEGMRLFKNGLDYILFLRHRARPVRISQSNDGLWRLGADQAIIKLAADIRLASPEDGSLLRESLEIMGRRRIGEAKILENNAIRLRLSNTWYFPESAGQWLSMSVRRIHWEYTFYRDGRWVTDVTINNAGGKVISSVRITVPQEAVFSDGRRGRVRHERQFAGSVGRWSFLIAPETTHRKRYEANYAGPGRVKIRIGGLDEAEGDTDGDGFDQSQGCYCLRAKAGHCRFMLVPDDMGLAGAVIRVAGRWNSDVTANSEGLALRNLLRLTDGSVLFVLPEIANRPKWVEVTGSAPSGGE